jgi:nitroimidazol reductase NimA-like FMN-containing flavoprotein (pyridoxamine 5'-phosphate oxidase superfamily)
MTPDQPSSEVRRYPDRARYDRETIDAILDEAPICHLGFVHEGHPAVIPTIHVRVGDRLIFHGSPASRMMRVLKAGAPVSVAVTLLDGLVLARAVIHHSMNYRSVVLFGTGGVVDDPDEKLEAMRVFTEKVLPGRWEDARQPTDKEFRSTMVAAVPIDAASAKVRTGPPADDEADLDLRVWAGEIPYRSMPGTPIPAPDLPAGIEFPAYLQRLIDRESTP